MRETNSNGKEVIYAPRDKTMAINKLAGLSDLAAKREWERAMLIALLVKRGRPGRKAANVSRNSGQDTIDEFTRRGIYGFRSKDAVRAYLRAWELSGQPMPVWGQKVEIPMGEFPDVATLYGRTVDDSADGSAEALDGSEEDGAADDTSEDASGQNDAPSPRPGPRPQPGAATILDQFLKMLDRLDPSLVIHGQPPDKRELLIKTFRSWLESLEEAAEADDS
jgi:hypothetical protein